MCFGIRALPVLDGGSGLLLRWLKTRPEAFFNDTQASALVMAQKDPEGINAVLATLGADKVQSEPQRYTLTLTASMMPEGGRSALHDGTLEARGDCRIEAGQ